MNHLTFESTIKGTNTARDTIAFVSNGVLDMMSIMILINNTTIAMLHLNMNRINNLENG